MPVRFLDTNILLRYLTRDDEDKALSALALLRRVEKGTEKVMTSPMVIFETVFTLSKSYRVPKSRIGELMVPIIALQALQLPDKYIYYIAFEVYVSNNISFADAYNAAYMQAHGISDVYSWDADFDKLKGISRFEPECSPDL